MGHSKKLQMSQLWRRSWNIMACIYIYILPYNLKNIFIYLILLTALRVKWDLQSALAVYRPVVLKHQLASESPGRPG